MFRLPRQPGLTPEGKTVTTNKSPDLEDIRSAMAELADSFATETELEPILDAVTDQAVRLIDGVDFADILLIDEQGHRSLAPTASLAVHLDTLQMESLEGPCLEAATNEPLVHSADLSREERWPVFAAAALQTGVRSMMSFHLYTYPSKNKRKVIGGSGALNLFGRTVGPFGLSDQAVAAMLATHAAAALVAANRQIQFESALTSRDIIAQAKGIVMERYTVDAVRAFSLMSKLSQDTNTPLREIAQRIIDSL
ncbi:ANTAR domain protein [Rhodococcus sp. EPR-157]|nr:ANTAR domain protein [Rhodococcus sp. EPR-157]